MARRTVFLGSPVTSRMDTRGPERPSWPDIDTAGAQLDAGVAQLSNAVALSLASETDWDLVRVWLAGSDQPELLIPGRVLFIPGGTKVQKIEPVAPCPPTRLYDASNVRNGLQSPTALPAGVAISMSEPGSDTSFFQNDSAAPLAVLRWNGAAYAAPPQPSWTSGGLLQPDGASNFVSLGEANNSHTWSRPADLSFDGGKFSIADYVEAGLIVGANLGAARVSKFATDAHGNAGDPTNGTTLRYSRYLLGGKLSAYGKLSSQFLGRLALDVFDTFPVCELGGHPYRPRLAPVRYITLPRVPVAGGAAAPATSLLTFPLVNARSVECLIRNSGAADLYVALVAPHVDDSIGVLDGVPYAEAAPAAQFLTISAGSEGSLVIDRPRHPLAKLIVGAAGGGAEIAADSVITIKRDIVE